jgi:hypothetical protein
MMHYISCFRIVYDTFFSRGVFFKVRPSGCDIFEALSQLNYKAWNRLIQSVETENYYRKTSEKFMASQQDRKHPSC